MNLMTINYNELIDVLESVYITMRQCKNTLKNLDVLRNLSIHIGQGSMIPY